VTEREDRGEGTSIPLYEDRCDFRRSGRSGEPGRGDGGRAGPAQDVHRQVAHYYSCY
jgi:hypothetical protein